jgi:hypothetical protein
MIITQVKKFISLVDGGRGAVYYVNSIVDGGRGRGRCFKTRFEKINMSNSKQVVLPIYYVRDCRSKTPHNFPAFTYIYFFFYFWPFLDNLTAVKNFGASRQMRSDFYHLNIFRWTKTGKKFAISVFGRGDSE